jgi:hypothetical protein
MHRRLSEEFFGTRGHGRLGFLVWSSVSAGRSVFRRTVDRCGAGMTWRSTARHSMGSPKGENFYLGRYAGVDSGRVCDVMP